MIRDYYSSMFKKPSTIICLLILLAYGFSPLIIANFFMSTSPPTGDYESYTLLSKNYWSYFNFVGIVPLVIPIYAIFSQCSRLVFKNETLIIKFSNFFSYLKTRMLFLLSDTVIFTLFIHIILTIRYFIMGGTISSYKQVFGILLCVFLNILGFMTFSLLFTASELVTNNAIIAFFIAFAFCAYDLFASHMGFMQIFIGRSFAVEPEKINNNVINLLIMLLILIILITVSLEVVLHKDFISPTEDKNAN